MPTATLPAVWHGRTGRCYAPAEGSRVRHGGMATVRKVVGRGPPVGTSQLPEGAPLALKLWHEGDESSLDQLQAEARVLVELSAREGEIPCPRLFDLVGSPLVTGLVMEWCPADMERWWREKLAEPDAYGRLMAALAESAHRLAAYHDHAARQRGLAAAHGDLKPTNILLSQDGRWLISDFGAAALHAPVDDGWDSTRAVLGTDNFLAPEVLFGATVRHPAAVDAWAFGATVIALLRLRRMALDGGPVPRNGTHSPRFRTTRANQVIEVYGRDPTRFRERDLEPEAFPDPRALPEADRRAVRDALDGIFGRGDDPREEQVAAELIEVLDRALAIAPAARFTDARALAGAFERLARSWIALSAQDPKTDLLVEATDPGDAAEDRDAALRRVQVLLAENRRLKERIAQLEGEVAFLEEEPTSVRVDAADEPTMAAPPPGLSRPVGILLALLLVLQLLVVVLVGTGLLLATFG